LDAFLFKKLQFLMISMYIFIWVLLVQLCMKNK
jgi:hypothetical protein